MNSAYALRSGWIELSDCFERQHSVKIETVPGGSDNYLVVELCRYQDKGAAGEDGVTDFIGACKEWRQPSRNTSNYFEANE